MESSSSSPQAVLLVVVVVVVVVVEAQYNAPKSAHPINHRCRQLALALE
jgi:hypothetical protein